MPTYRAPDAGLRALGDHWVEMGSIFYDMGDDVDVGLAIRDACRNISSNARLAAKVEHLMYVREQARQVAR